MHDDLDPGLQRRFDRELDAVPPSAPWVPGRGRRSAWSIPLGFTAALVLLVAAVAGGSAVRTYRAGSSGAVASASVAPSASAARTPRPTTATALDCTVSWAKHYRTIADLVHDADVVVHGTVISQDEVQLRPGFGPQATRSARRTTLRVSETLKGAPLSEIRVLEDVCPNLTGTAGDEWLLFASKSTDPATHGPDEPGDHYFTLGGPQGQVHLRAGVVVGPFYRFADLVHSYEGASVAEIIADVRAAAAVAPSPGGGASNAAAVSGDGKNVVDGRQQGVLAIDNDQIVEWFRTRSQLCGANQFTWPATNTWPDRRAFCTDRATFKAQTRFASVVGSPDGAAVGFTIKMVPSSEPLSSDAGQRQFLSAAGIFITSTGRIQMLSYLFALDEQFIGFSPTGKSFIYQGGCFEGNCALFVHDSVSLAEKVSVNTGNDRGQTVTFVRWLTDRAFEYKQYTQPFHEPNGRGPELKTASY